MPSTPRAQTERLLTAAQLAELLNVNPKWVYSACRLYDMPYFQIGRYKRFSPSQIFEWLEEGGSIVAVDD